MGFERRSRDPARAAQGWRHHPLGRADKRLQALALARAVRALERAEPGGRPQGAREVRLAARRQRPRVSPDSQMAVRRSSMGSTVWTLIPTRRKISGLSDVHW